MSFIFLNISIYCLNVSYYYLLALYMAYDTSQKMVDIGLNEFYGQSSLFVDWF